LKSFFLSLKAAVGSALGGAVSEVGRDRSSGSEGAICPLSLTQGFPAGLDNEQGFPWVRAVFMFVLFPGRSPAVADAFLTVTHFFGSGLFMASLLENAL
jgi:hypothetical protein